MYKLFMHNYSDDIPLRSAVLQAMQDRGVSQLDLADLCGLSQGHLSKVLRSLPMGRRTRSRLQKWLDYPDEDIRSRILNADDLISLGAMLKQHCEELARASRRAGRGANATNGGGAS